MAFVYYMERSHRFNGAMYRSWSFFTHLTLPILDSILVLQNMRNFYTKIYSFIINIYYTGRDELALPSTAAFIIFYIY